MLRETLATREEELEDLRKEIASLEAKRAKEDEEEKGMGAAAEQPAE